MDRHVHYLASHLSVHGSVPLQQLLQCWSSIGLENSTAAESTSISLVTGQRQQKHTIATREFLQRCIWPLLSANTKPF